MPPNEFEGQARARRRPFEDHRQRLAGKQAFAAVTAQFYRARSINDAAQIGSRDLDQIEEMAEGFHPAVSSLRRVAAAGRLALRLSCAQARSNRATPSAISCSLTINCRSKATTMPPPPAA